jgi:hypothetical protein
MPSQDFPESKTLQMTISDDVHAAGRCVLAAQSASIAAELNSALNRFIGSAFKAETGSILDLKGKSSCIFGTVIRVADGVDTSQPVSSDTTAVVIDVCDEIGIDRLRDCYARVAEAKRLSKTPIPKGQTLTNITLGVIFAVRATVPMEVIGEELNRLNDQTPGQYRPDMVVVGSTGVINYGVQFPGEGIAGDYLPPAEGAVSKFAPAFYVVPVMRPTGTHAFNKMLAFILAHLGIFLPTATDSLPDWLKILDGVTTTAVTLGGYQYNLAGELVPVPREHYNDRYLAPRPLLIEDKSGEVLGSVQYLQWQDGAAILLRGKLPLEGLLIFMDKYRDMNGSVIRRPGAQIFYVLPINKADFSAWLGRF